MGLWGSPSVSERMGNLPGLLVRKLPGLAREPWRQRALVATMYVTKSYKFTGIGAMDVTKPYTFIGVWGHGRHEIV